MTFRQMSVTLLLFLSSESLLVVIFVLSLINTSLEDSFHLKSSDKKMKSLSQLFEMVQHITSDFC